MSKPDIPVNIADQTPKPRIVQYRKKRYSIRLEPVFWRALERMARERRKKLGQFLIELEEKHEGINFASFLRSYCMLEAEQTAAEHALENREASIAQFLRTSPAPGALIRSDLHIVDGNDAFYQWLGEDQKRIEGVDVTSLFQIRSRAPLQDAWKDLMSGKNEQLDARIIRMVPGRVTTAQARFIKMKSMETAQDYGLLWIVSTPKASLPQRTTPLPAQGKSPPQRQIEQGRPAASSMRNVRVTAQVIRPPTKTETED
ncbi:ribbon-helix-helix domain-containing protein [Kiloniella sp. b19]|uniref:ribbon-helix-helix domain-containing protein n=1 Tax=Kiloniella sp. GXU_MW_B19 TaxID=3141326 RepID=UPI0031D81CB7